jgi:hypothetical protein
VFVHCLYCLGAIFSRPPGSHLLIRALGSQGGPQGPPRVPPNKIPRFPIRCPIRSYYSMVLLAHIVPHIPTGTDGGQTGRWKSGNEGHNKKAKGRRSERRRSRRNWGAK